MNLALEILEKVFHLVSRLPPKMAKSSRTGNYCYSGIKKDDEGFSPQDFSECRSNQGFKRANVGQAESANIYAIATFRYEIASLAPHKGAKNLRN